MKTVKCCPICKSSQIHKNRKLWHCYGRSKGVLGEVKICNNEFDEPDRKINEQSDKKQENTNRKQKPSERWRSIPTPEEFSNILIDTYKDDEFATEMIFARTVYLTGSRVSEVLALTIGQFNLQEDKGNPYLEISNMEVKKNKKPVYRTVMYPWDTYCEIIYRFIDMLKRRNSDRMGLRPFHFNNDWGHKTVQRMKWKGKSMFPHFLRTLRQSHCSEFGEFTIPEIVAEWKYKSMVTPLHYIFSDSSKRLAKFDKLRIELKSETDKQP